MVQLSPHRICVKHNLPGCQHSTGGIMTYEEFKQQLVTSLRELFPAGTCITIRPFSHNNHILLDGLTILEPGSNVSPAIYLNHYYRSYQQGTSFSALQSCILRYYYEHCSVRTVDTSFFTCFENIRSRIVYKLIHYEKNRELLKEVPHLPWMDLAIVFYCLIQERSGKNASIPIFHEHLDYWNISVDTLFSLARQNTPLLLSFCCDSLADLIFPVLDVLPEEERRSAQDTLISESVPMYVLTNHLRLNGACCILYQDALKQVSDQLRDSLYILPSSVHEVIAIPASHAGNPGELPRIVGEINLAEVSPEEILSDRVYFYDRSSRRLSLY